MAVPGKPGLVKVLPARGSRFELRVPGVDALLINAQVPRFSRCSRPASTRTFRWWDTVG